MWQLTEYLENVDMAPSTTFPMCISYLTMGLVSLLLYCFCVFLSKEPTLLHEYLRSSSLEAMRCQTVVDFVDAINTDCLNTVGISSAAAAIVVICLIIWSLSAFLKTENSVLEAFAHIIRYNIKFVFAFSYIRKPFCCNDWSIENVVCRVYSGQHYSFVAFFPCII